MDKIDKRILAAEECLTMIRIHIYDVLAILDDIDSHLGEIRKKRKERLDG